MGEVLSAHALAVFDLDGGGLGVGWCKGRAEVDKTGR